MPKKGGTKQKKFYGKSVEELLNKAQAALDGPNPLDIDTVEQQYTHKEYGNVIKVTPKCAEDEEKAKKMQDLISYMIEKKEGEFRKAITESLLTGYGINPKEFLIDPKGAIQKRKGTKHILTIPVDDIRKELKWQQR